MSKDDLAYSKQLALVTNAIAKYSRLSVLKISMKYLASKRNGSDKSSNIKNAPWLVFLLIKISSQENGRLTMNEADFVRVINLLFRLQDYLFKPSCGNILMLFRPLINQQVWIGGGEGKSIMSLVRQCKILGGKEKYEVASRNVVGFGVTSFSIIWLHIFLQMVDRKDGQVFELNMLDLLFRLQAAVKIDEIINFFGYFGIRYKDLPAYFEQYKEKSNGTFEDYYYDTPLKRKPFLVSGAHVYIFNCDLIFSSFPYMLVDIIKRADLKGELGKDIEGYVGACLAKTSKVVHSESDLKNIYREFLIPLKGNKFPDFAVEESDFVFVESKAVEQADWLKVSSDPALLKKVTHDHILKALVQCQMCAARLKSISKYADKNFKAMVVTHGDFGFLTAANIENFIGENLADYVREQCGVELVIPLEQVVYITIADFEALTLGMQSGDIVLSEFISSVANDYLASSPKLLSEKITAMCGEDDVYRRASEIFSVNDDFISGVVGFVNGGSGLRIRNSGGLISLHQHVMIDINESIERIRY